MKLDRSALTNGGIALLAIASFVALYATRERPTTEQRGAREQNLFAQFPRPRLQRIELSSERGPVRVELRGDGCLLSGVGPGDAEACEGLVRAAESATFVRQLDPGQFDSKAYGIGKDSPRMSLQFGNERAELVLGAPATQYPDARFVSVRYGSEPERVGVIRRELARELFKSADELRPRTIFPHSPSEVAELRVTRAGKTRVFKRRAGPDWSQSDGRRARRDALEGLLLRVADLRAERFLPAAPGTAPAKAAQDPAAGSEAGLQLEMTLATPPARSVALSFGPACPDHPELIQVHEVSRQVAACIGPEILQAGDEALANLEDNGLFALHMDEVETLTLERDGKKYELTRTERGFRLSEPERSEVALDVGNRHLDRLLALRGKRVEDAAALAPGAVQGRVRLVSSVIEGTPRFEELVEISKAPGTSAPGSLRVRRAADATILELEPEAARLLTADTTWLRASAIFEFSPSELARLTLRSGSELQRLRRVDASLFELEEPKGFALDASLALNVVQALGTLRAEQWISAADDGSFGLQKPELEIELEFEPRPAGTSDARTGRRATLKLGRRTGPWVYASVTDRPGVFTVPSQTVAELGGLLLDRTLVHFDPDALASIELEYQGKRWQLVRSAGPGRADAWTAPSPGAAEPWLSPEHAHDLAADLLELTAEFAVHTGAERSNEGFVRRGLRLRYHPLNGPEQELRFGDVDRIRDTRVRYARVTGRSASYAVLESRLSPLFALLGR